MSPISLSPEYIKKLIKISKNAGEAIMDVYESEFDVNIKSDQSPITKADILSNKIIFKSLKKLTPDIPILSEESSEIPFKTRSRWDKYWLIDPLDGTKEFIKRNGEFTVNIALIENNKPIVGVIHIPDKNQTYWGYQNEGSFSETDGIIKRIHVSNTDQEKIRIVMSRSHNSGQIEKYLNEVGDYEAIKVGSSIKFCLIANGAVDLYPRIGPTSEWDVAAGQAILNYAGGVVMDSNLKSLSYNMKDSLINPSFVASNKRSTCEAYLKLISKL